MARKATTTASGKTESLTVRLDPKIRYGLELLARKQRRTLSSVVEWALHKAIYDKTEGLYDEQGGDANLLDFLWDVEEADRHYHMAIIRPALQNFEEERLVKLIAESDFYHYLKDQFGHLTDPNTGNFTAEGHQKVRENLREHYDTFKKISAGALDKDAMPKPPRGWKQKSDKKDVK